MRSIRLLNCAVCYILLTLTLSACSGASGSNPAANLANISANNANPGDISPPTAPGNLRNASGSPTSSSVQLIWDASTDNIAVTGYRVMRGNTILTTGTSTSYTDTSVSSGITYQYSIVALDAANNTTSSNTLSVSTLNINNSTGVTTLNWTPPTENTDDSSLTDLSGYKIYYGLSPDSLTNFITLNNSGLTSYVIENLSINTTYYFSITAINSLNIESDVSNIISKNITG